MPAAIGQITFALSANGAGLIADATLPSFSGALLAIVTTPGEPHPSPGYSITIIDANGLDVLGGAGRNRSNIEAQHTIVRQAKRHPIIDAGEELILRVTGNTEPHARITGVLYFGLPDSGA